MRLERKIERLSALTGEFTDQRLHRAARTRTVPESSASAADPQVHTTSLPCILLPSLLVFRLT